jgi:hypothetical protein
MTGNSKPRHHSKFTKPAAETPPQRPVNSSLLSRLGFSEGTIHKLEQVDARFEAIVVEAKRELIAAGKNIEFEVTEGWRTAKQQNADYRRGTSPCDGYRNKSEHQKGAALDLSVYCKGVYDTNGADANYTAVIDACAAAAKKLGYDLHLGRFFTNHKGKPKPDYDHIEIKGNIASGKPAEGVGGGKAPCIPCRQPDPPRHSIMDDILKDNILIRSLPKLPGLPF